MTTVCGHSPFAQFLTLTSCSYYLYSEQYTKISPTKTLNGFC